MAEVPTSIRNAGGGMRDVVVTDVQMPFWSMVRFMIKWSLAAIPALVILFLIYLLLVGVAAGVITGRITLANPFSASATAPPAGR